MIRQYGGTDSTGQGSGREILAREMLASSVTILLILGVDLPDFNFGGGTLRPHSILQSVMDS